MDNRPGPARLSIRSYAPRVRALNLIAEQLQHLLDEQPIEWQRQWGGVVIAAIRSLRGRGKRWSCERIQTYALLDAEVAAGRDPDALNFAGVVARKVMTDSRSVRRWRKQWKAERGHN